MAKRRAKKRPGNPVRSAPRNAVGKRPSGHEGDDLTQGSPHGVSPSRLTALLSVPGAPLLVLRAFLGVTFTFAGLQKLANPNFFRATAPGSFQQQLRGSILTSPLHHLLTPALHASTPVALLISFGEVAVGLGTLVGLFSRVAAVGGVLLSLSFFLTVSFNDNPYYYGPDIVFLFAWTPFVLSTPGAWSLDALFARRAERATDSLRKQQSAADRRRGVAPSSLSGEFSCRRPPQPVSLERSALPPGASSQPSVVLWRFPAIHVSRCDRWRWTESHHEPEHLRPDHLGQARDDVNDGGTVKCCDAEGIAIGPASDVPVGGAASFTDPKAGVPALVVQIRRGDFRAFSAVCPHAGCQVQFDQQSDLFICPCHGSVFDGSTGAVQRGPAATGLSQIAVALGQTANFTSTVEHRP